MEVKSTDCQDYALEFVIDKSFSIHVEENKDRIFQLFNVKANLKDVFNKSNASKQWIHLQGPQDKAVKAKEYILALTSAKETIKMKNVWDHPLLTAQKIDEIEESSCAVLSRCDDRDLAISGTELSVVIAQSLIDDMFSKASKDVLTAVHRQEIKGTAADKEDYYTDECFMKDVYPDGCNAGLNCNNSSHTSLMSQLRAVPTLPETQKSMSGVLSSKVNSPMTSNPGRSDFNHNCLSMTGMPVRRNGTISSEQQSLAQTKLVYPHPSCHSMFASGSAISPLSTTGQPLTLNRSSFVTPHRATADIVHSVNHKGDGSEVQMRFLPDKQRQIDRDKDQWNEELMDVCCMDSKWSAMSKFDTHHQAMDQETYLRHLGSSLHYTEEDIVKGLGCYNMDDVVRPADYLRTLREIKAQRHGGSNPDLYCNEIVVSSVPSTLPTALSTYTNRSTTQIASHTLTPERDTGDMDESLICMGSVSENVSAIMISSEDETDEDVLQPTAQAKGPSKTQENARGPVIAKELVNRALGISELQHPTNNLRYIVIDGSNVAMAHGNNKVFSAKGLEICIQYFLARGHDRITAFVPEWRRYSSNQTMMAGKAILEKLGDEGYVKFTPSRRVNGATISSYDDRYVLNLAEKEDGIIVSNDQFRDLCQERTSYRNLVAKRLLQFMFVGNHFMPPDDPLGRHGPDLDEFLRYPDPAAKPTGTSDFAQSFRTKSLPQPPLPKERNVNKRSRKLAKAETRLLRKPQVTQHLYELLIKVFPQPEQQPQIQSVLQNHPSETDINTLTNYCMSALFS